MFEFGRELRRLFGGDAGAKPFQDGLTGGDATLLELLDLKMLCREGKTADVAAGRMSTRDRASRLLEAAGIWREVARRTGDVVALRKAAATAESSAKAFEGSHRPLGRARAKVEQAACAMLGADLYGDEGLNAAAVTVLAEARQVGGAPAAQAEAMIAALHARPVASSGDETSVRLAAARFNAPVSLMETAARKSGGPLRLAAAEARLARADMLCAAGIRLKDAGLLDAAVRDCDAAVARLDADFEPLTHARAAMARAAAMVLRAEMGVDLGALADAVAALAEAVAAVTREQSPLDWAKAQIGLAAGLQSLGEAGMNEQALEKAVTCYDRAMVVLKASPALTLSAMVAGNRAVCLGRCAELTGDLAVLDAAEAAFKGELAGGAHQRDPVAWALIQTNLARLYETRAELTGRDRGARAAAALAYSEALEVFSERGLRSLSDLASQGLERMRKSVRPKV